MVLSALNSLPTVKVTTGTRWQQFETDFDVSPVDNPDGKTARTLFTCETWNPETPILFLAFPFVAGLGNFNQASIFFLPGQH